MSIFGHQMRFNLQDGFHSSILRRYHLRSIIRELLWFLNGDTNIGYLKENNVSIWDEWADENGDLGGLRRNNGGLGGLRMVVRLTNLATWSNSLSRIQIRAVSSFQHGMWVNWNKWHWHRAMLSSSSTWQMASFLVNCISVLVMYSRFPI